MRPHTHIPTHTHTHTPTLTLTPTPTSTPTPTPTYTYKHFCKQNEQANTYTPEEIYAMVLQTCKGIAEKYLGNTLFVEWLLTCSWGFYCRFIVGLIVGLVYRWTYGWLTVGTVFFRPTDLPTYRPTDPPTHRILPLHLTLNT